MNLNFLITRNFLKSFSSLRKSNNTNNWIVPILATRNLTTTKNVQPKIEIEEINIPVPWGDIAAKRWTLKNSISTNLKPVLCIHGWKDNAASFDKILPLILPHCSQFEFLSIDLPGHGWSSHLPFGMTYQYGDCLILIQRIINHFKWEKLTIFGHSMGAILGFLFSAPHALVDKLIAVDALTPMIFTKNEMLNMTPTLISDTLEFERKVFTRKPPLYTHEEIIERVRKSHLGGLDEESLNVMVSRGIRETPPGSGKFKFSHDIRVQYLPVMPFGERQVKFIAKSFRSDVLHFRASHGIEYEKEYVISNVDNWIANSRARKNETHFIRIDGGHHVHLTTPEKISPYIVQFLNK